MKNVGICMLRLKEFFKFWEIKVLFNDFFWEIWWEILLGFVYNVLLYYVSWYFNDVLCEKEVLCWYVFILMLDNDNINSSVNCKVFSFFVFLEW